MLAQEVTLYCCTPPTGEEQTRKVESIVEHPQYNVGTQEYDIALLKLAQPLVLDGVTVSPVCLPPYLAKFSSEGTTSCSLPL